MKKVEKQNRKSAWEPCVCVFFCRWFVRLLFVIFSPLSFPAHSLVFLTKCNTHYSIAIRWAPHIFHFHPPFLPSLSLSLSHILSHTNSQTQKAIYSMHNCILHIGIYHLKKPYLSTSAFFFTLCPFPHAATSHSALPVSMVSTYIASSLIPCIYLYDPPHMHAKKRRRRERERKKMLLPLRFSILCLIFVRSAHT